MIDSECRVGWGGGGSWAYGAKWIEETKLM